MKKTTLIRIFALFPLLGILLPDLSIVYSDAKLDTPVSHIVICICMAVIIISTFLMERYQARYSSMIDRQQEL